MNLPVQGVAFEAVVEVSHEGDGVCRGLHQVGQGRVELVLSIVLPGNRVDSLYRVLDVKNSSLRILKFDLEFRVEHSFD